MHSRLDEGNDSTCTIGDVREYPTMHFLEFPKIFSQRFHKKLWIFLEFPSQNCIVGLLLTRHVVYSAINVHINCNWPVTLIVSVTTKLFIGKNKKNSNKYAVIFSCMLFTGMYTFLKINRLIGILDTLDTGTVSVTCALRNVIVYRVQGRST